MKYTEKDISDNMGLVHMIARRMLHLTTSGLMDYEDLVSEGTLGLIHALDRFNPDLGFRFSSFGSACIRGFMLRGHRTLFQEKWKALNSRFEVPYKTVSIYKQSEDDEDFEFMIGISDKGSEAKDIVHTVHLQDVREQLVKILSRRERQVLQLLRQGLIQSEIADLLGLSRQAISLYKGRIVTKARQHFGLEQEVA